MSEETPFVPIEFVPIEVKPEDLKPTNNIRPAWQIALLKKATLQASHLAEKYMPAYDAFVIGASDSESLVIRAERANDIPPDVLMAFAFLIMIRSLAIALGESAGSVTPTLERQVDEAGEIRQELELRKRAIHNLTAQIQKMDRDAFMDAARSVDRLTKIEELDAAVALLYEGIGETVHACRAALAEPMSVERDIIQATLVRLDILRGAS